MNRDQRKHMLTSVLQSTSNQNKQQGG